MTYDKNQIYPEYIIYKLCSDDTDLFYVGSTRNMVQRRKNHKSSCNNPNSPAYNNKKSKTIREFGGWDNWRLVPIEKMENVSRFEAECREEVVRVELNALLNSQRASCGGLTEQEYNAEYYKEHQDYYKEKHAEYYKANREYFENYRKEHREELYRKQKKKFDCDCGGRFTQQNKSTHFKSKLHIRYLEQIE